MTPEYGRKWLTINGTLDSMKRQNTKAILAANLRRLMDSSSTLDTQVKVATRAKIAQSTVGRLLRGEVHAQLAQVEALAETFRVTVAELLTDPTVDHQPTSSGPDYAHLPEPEKAHIAAFIEFITARHATNENEKSLTIERRSEAAPGLKQRLMQAIQRELNDDSLTFANDDKKENNATERRKRSSTR